MSYDLTEDGPSGAHVRRAYIAPFMDLVPEIDSSAFIAPTAAIIGAVVSLIVFLVSFPEFLRFRGYVNLLEEIKEIQSTSELRRRKAEGVEAAEALGAGHLQQWNAFLESRGVKR